MDNQLTSALQEFSSSAMEFVGSAKRFQKAMRVLSGAMPEGKDRDALLKNTLSIAKAIEALDTQVTNTSSLL